MAKFLGDIKFAFLKNHSKSVETQLALKIQNLELFANFWRLSKKYFSYNFTKGASKTSRTSYIVAFNVSTITHSHRQRATNVESTKNCAKPKVAWKGNRPEWISSRFPVLVTPAFESAYTPFLPLHLTLMVSFVGTLRGGKDKRE